MRTNAQTRKYIADIVCVHAQITALNLRKRAIAKKLGFGTWRSKELPGVTVVCGRGSGGWVVQWVKVARDLADKLKMSDTELTRATFGHRTQHHATPTVSVKTDKAKLTNPKLRVY